MPAVASATHKCRKGCPVIGLIPVPLITIPPRGAVTALKVVCWGFGTPIYWTEVVAVVAVISVWALALSATNAKRRMKQNQTLGEAICEQTALRAVVRVEDLIFVPSRPECFKLQKSFFRAIG